MHAGVSPWRQLSSLAPDGWLRPDGCSGAGTGLAVPPARAQWPVVCRCGVVSHGIVDNLRIVRSTGSARPAAVVPGIEHCALRASCHTTTQKVRSCSLVPLHRHRRPPPPSCLPAVRRTFRLLPVCVRAAGGAVDVRPRRLHLCGHVRARLQVRAGVETAARSKRSAALSS